MISAAALGLAVLLAASRASAQGYLGASLGSTDADDGNAIPELIDAGTVDGEDSGFKLFGGYQFNRNLAVELAYVDLGKLEYSGTFGGLSVTGGKVQTTGFNASAVGIVPLSPSFSLFGKVGVFSWLAKARDVTGGAPFAGEEDDADVSFGLGAAYHVNANFSVRAEWEQFEALDKISLISIGVAVRF
jgi:OOP family OmpA-OmpF porin